MVETSSRGWPGYVLESRVETENVFRWWNFPETPFGIGNWFWNQSKRPREFSRNRHVCSLCLNLRYVSMFRGAECTAVFQFVIFWPSCFFLFQILLVNVFQNQLVLFTYDCRISIFVLSHDTKQWVYLWSVQSQVLVTFSVLSQPCGWSVSPSPINARKSRKIFRRVQSDNSLPCRGRQPQRRRAMLRVTTAYRSCRSGIGKRRTVRNQGQFGPKVTGTTDMRNTLGVPLTTTSPTGRSILLLRSKPRSLTESVPWLPWWLNCNKFACAKHRYFIEGRSAKYSARLEPARNAKKVADPFCRSWFVFCSSLTKLLNNF